MTKSDRIVSDLMNALDTIRREAEKPDANRHFIIGAAEQAMKACDAVRTRDVDGYLVATHDRAIDAAVNAGIEEAWRVCSCNIDLSNERVMEAVQAIIYTAVRNGI